MVLRVAVDKLCCLSWWVPTQRISTTKAPGIYLFFSCFFGGCVPHGSPEGTITGHCLLRLFRATTIPADCTNHTMMRAEVGRKGQLTWHDPELEFGPIVLVEGTRRLWCVSVRLLVYVLSALVTPYAGQTLRLNSFHALSFRRGIFSQQRRRTTI